MTTQQTSQISTNHNLTGGLMKSYRQAGRAVTVGRRIKGIVLTNTSAMNTQIGKITPQPINNQNPPSVPVKYQRIIRQPRKHQDGFGARKARFKPNYKRIFNTRDPGPGSHNPYKSMELASKICNISQILGNDPTTPNMDPSTSKKGYGVGFASEDQRFSQQFAQNREQRTFPGPGNYDPQNPAYPKPRSCIIKNKAAFSLPFNQNNPLNYVKPLTVNIYFKSQNPGPGIYNPKKLQNNSNLNYHAAFRSESKRDQIFKPGAGGAGGGNQVPPVGIYQLDNAQFIKQLKEKDVPSKNFRKPIGATRVKVNLYDPHSELKDPEQPGPGHYQVRTNQPMIQEKSLKFKSNQFWSQFVVGDVDRFGQQMKKKTAIIDNPGPGAYTGELVRQKLGYYDQLRAGFNSTTDKDKMASLSILGGKKEMLAPGPAYYVPEKENKKISFHLNAERKFVIS